MEKKISYLASPYSHPSPVKRHERYLTACYVASLMIRKGILVFSPIASSHSISTNLSGESYGWDFWKEFDLAIIEVCKDFYILTIDGWDKSVGVTAEIQHAKKLGLPIYTVNENGTTNWMNSISKE